MTKAEQADTDRMDAGFGAALEITEGIVDEMNDYAELLARLDGLYSHYGEGSYQAAAAAIRELTAQLATERAEHARLLLAFETEANELNAERSENTPRTNAFEYVVTEAHIGRRVVGVADAHQMEMDLNSEVRIHGSTTLLLQNKLHEILSIKRDLKAERKAHDATELRLEQTVAQLNHERKAREEAEEVAAHTHVMMREIAERAEAAERDKDFYLRGGERTRLLDSERRAEAAEAALDARATLDVQRSNEIADLQAEVRNAFEQCAKVSRNVFDDVRESGNEGSLYQQGWEASASRIEDELRALAPDRTAATEDFDPCVPCCPAAPSSHEYVAEVELEQNVKRLRGALRYCYEVLQPLQPGTPEQAFEAWVSSISGTTPIPD